MRSVLEQVPSEMRHILDQYDWAVGQGYIEKGVRNIMWGQLERGRNHLVRAAGSGASVQRPFLNELVAHLLNYEAEFGSEAAQNVLHNLTRELERVSERDDLQYLSGLYFVNSAFRDYRKGQYKETLPNVIKAVISDKSYLADRGVLALLSRSMLKSPLQILKK